MFGCRLINQLVAYAASIHIRRGPLTHLISLDLHAYVIPLQWKAFFESGPMDLNS